MRNLSRFYHPDHGNYDKQACQKLAIRFLVLKMSLSPYWFGNLIASAWPLPDDVKSLSIPFIISTSAHLPSVNHDGQITGLRA
jgi:hypothetical protein